jgi:predicted DNA-binding WGR domain protein
MRSGHTHRPRELGAGGGRLRIIGHWALEAHQPGKNHHRRYQVTVGRDLLDHWTVAILYGRVGQEGQERRYVSANPDDMCAVIRDRLRRRPSAPKRIGCSYRLSAFHAAQGFDAASWLPGEVMARFFRAG